MGITNITTTICHLGHELAVPGRTSQLYDQDRTSCYNKTKQLSCPQVIDIVQVTKISYNRTDAIVKLILQSTSPCTDNWVYVNASSNAQDTVSTVKKCSLEANFSVSDGVCFWRCTCDEYCAVVLVETPETNAWQLCELNIL